MSKEQVYDYIKKYTYKQVDDKGSQLMIPVDKIISDPHIKLNEATIYANLKKLSKRSDVKYTINKVRLTDEYDKEYIFEMKYWWIE